MAEKVVLLVFSLVFLCLCGFSRAQNNVTECSNSVECSDYDVGVCNNGTCSCISNLTAGCFFTNNATNQCELVKCAVFTNGTDLCRMGTKSRTTALLLSIFLINFGAANFYIERYDFAVAQIVLGLLVCVLQFGACGAACARDDSDETSKPCVTLCGLNAFFSLAIFCWWIADLVIFALNDRDDGSGCPLYT